MGSGDWYHGRGGQQVGPVSMEELARRLGAGEVGSEDLVWREGMSDWQPARVVPELAGMLRTVVAPAALPGLGPSAPAQPAWAPGGFDPSAPPEAGGAPMLGYGGYTPPKPRASGLAIAAFVISLVALLAGVTLALPALVMGIIAVYNAKRTGRPKGFAVAAVVISGLELLVAGGLITYFLLRR